MTRDREEYDSSSTSTTSEAAKARGTNILGAFSSKGEAETMSPVPQDSISSESSRSSIPVPPPPAAPDPYVGTTIDGRYKVEEVLGEGGMGVVYLARHKAIDKKMAVKVLRADVARNNGEVTERFLQEARAASSIGNPHIIDISDFGELPDGSTYFVMEYLDGSPLSKVLDGAKPKPLPVPRLCRIARQICDGLAAAHAREITHRDLKPDNIFLIQHGHQDDFVKILDFGIAKVSKGGSKLTRAGAIFGTPHYMSPEQAAGSTVDSRTDIYALGVILYEMASGEVPFDADNFMGILTQHMYKAPVPIRALVPPRDVPPGLEAVILKCLSKKPEQRYQTMEELAADLDKVAEGLVPDAVPELMARSGGFNVPADFFKERGMSGPLPATPPGLRKRTPWGMYAGIAGVLAAVLIVVGIFAGSASTTASTPPPTPSDPSPSKPPAIEPTPTTTALPAPKVSQVLFASDPLDARVFRGDEDLGNPPLTLEVVEGSPVTLEIRLEGYRSESVVLDGSKPRVAVKLEAEEVVPAKAPVKETTRKKKPSRVRQPQKLKGTLGGTSEIVNPWGN